MDERTCEHEMNADGYRVAVVYPGRRVATFDVDECSTQEARAWAEARGDEAGGFSLAARFDHVPKGGVTLMWLTPPPEDVMEALDA
ncbi:hypothetical protein [Sanguibacter suaedae]|uniref:hypothetical protein n=1 Tax=Sanguibacter suaedae TaxID=2795737 RepID=UPI0027DCE01D|nr:hypothetical protein [Sanguibacter suaedae]